MSRTVRALEKGVISVNNVLNAVGTLLLFALMALGAADVFGRYLLNKPVLGALEVSQVIMASMVFLSWGYTQVQRGHVAVDILISHFPRRARGVTDIFNLIVGFVLFVLIAWQGAVLAKLYAEGDRLVAGVVRWPLAPFQALTTVGAVVISLVLLTQMAQTILQMKRKG